MKRILQLRKKVAVARGDTARHQRPSVAAVSADSENSSHSSDDSVERGPEAGQDPRLKKVWCECANCFGMQQILAKHAREHVKSWGTWRDKQKRAQGQVEQVTICLRYSMLTDGSILVRSRWGAVQIGDQAARVFLPFDPSLWNVPNTIPVGHAVNVWGRSWIVKPSGIHPSVGLGVFADEDIIVPPNSQEEDLPCLFPFCGSLYSKKNWSILTKDAPSFRSFGMHVDGYPRDDINGHLGQGSSGRIIDGDPERSSNIAGFINSPCMPKSKDHVCHPNLELQPNVEWVFISCPPPGCPESSIDFYIGTFATRSIRAGEELLALYAF